MVTESLPLPCFTCLDSEEVLESNRQETPGSARRYSRDESTNAAPANQTDQIRRVSVALQEQISFQQTTTSRAAPTPTPAATSTSALETPPSSPNLSALPAHDGPHSRRDSSFRKTYDDEDKKRLVPCINCALTIPPHLRSQLPAGAPGSPHSSGHSDNGSAVLRSCKPYERASSVAEGAATPDSLMSESSDSDRQPGQTTPRRRSRTLVRTATDSSGSKSPQSHVHYMEYTSTHDPQTPVSFSLLRQSCLRALTLEKLPTSTTVSTTNGPYKPATPSSSRTPTSPNPSTSYFPSQSANPTPNPTGPIFFGDPHAGYTTAFIFRVPDAHARGRKRIYALIAHSTYREQRSLKAFKYLSAVFADLAAWILALADAESARAAREREDAAAALEGARVSAQLDKTPTSVSGAAGHGGASGRSLGKPMQVSAFLAGRPCDPDGVPRPGMSGPTGLRARGLAEVCGREELFIELHARFVALAVRLRTAF